MQRKNLGSMVRKKKGGFIGPMLGLMAPLVGKLIGGLVSRKKGNGIKGFGSGIKGFGSGIKGYGEGIKRFGEGHKKSKSGKGIFDVVKKIASGPLAKMAGDALKKKMMEVAVSKSVDFAGKKLSKKGNGMKKKKKMQILQTVGVPSHNKNAVVTVSKPMKEIKNPIKPGRKKIFFM